MLRLLARALEHREAGVAHDAQQPRARVVAAQRSRCSESAHRRLLHRVFGGLLARNSQRARL
jgi:hypothetical protein